MVAISHDSRLIFIDAAAGKVALLSAVAAGSDDERGTVISSDASACPAISLTPTPDKA